MSKYQFFDGYFAFEYYYIPFNLFMLTVDQYLGSHTCFAIYEDQYKYVFLNLFLLNLI